MEKLPLEIAFEIFYRLPPESVVRCKFVCKSWCNLLPSGDDSNNFANMHLLRHRQYLQYNSTLNFIALHKFRSYSKDINQQEAARRSSGGAPIIGGEFEFTELNEHELTNKLSYKVVKTINFPDHIGIRSCSWDCSIDPKLAGSCNGLVCLPRIYGQCSNLLIKDRIWICNPLLNEYVPLPVSDLQLKYCNTDTTCNMVVGFGHNPSTDEYKVVRVYYPDLNSYVGEVEVYTLGKSSMWRSKGTIEYRLRTSKRPVLVNGSLHWLAKDRTYINYLHIVSFNLEVEEFHMIPAVPQVGNRNNGYYGLVQSEDSELKELGGCLCLIHKGEKLMDIWVWKDYMNNKEYSWVQEFSIKWRKGKRDGYLYSPCAIKKNKKKENGDDDDDIVLMWCERKELVYYDPKRRNLEYVARGGSRRQIINRLPFDHDPILHINSLISLKALGEEDAKLYAENHLKRKLAYQDGNKYSNSCGCRSCRCRKNETENLRRKKTKIGK